MVKNSEMRRILTLACLLVSCILMSQAQKTTTDIHRLRDGDLLFVVVSEENPITEVTRQASAPSIDHVGIYHLHEGRPMVIEANTSGVVETPFEDFMQEGACLLVGRVSNHPDIAQSLRNAHDYLGKPYDFIYMPDDEAIYCSELVLRSFVDRDGNPIFHPVAMSFHDQQGEITPYWKDYYSRRSLDVPEGKDGSNPSELSRRANIKIKYKFTRIAK